MEIKKELRNFISGFDSQTLENIEKQRDTGQNQA